jgi:lipopolysaccharide/colanic/teichoic acid biosynthesis glycosyltransferase
MSYETIKRIMDIVFTLILMVIFSPILIIVPFLIKLDSPGPIVYRQKRVGKADKEFYMYKFRSMVEGAEKILKKNRSLLTRFKNGDWKLTKDPRVTKFGKILRVLTIDEMPQFLNVLKGEMSLVGPRAYREEELDEQQKKHPKTKKLIKQILTVKPGITGPWQTSGRNVIPFKTRAEMDAEYARARSIWRDIVIVLKTPLAMISKW